MFNETNSDKQLVTIFGNKLINNRFKYFFDDNDGIYYPVVISDYKDRPLEHRFRIIQNSFSKITNKKIENFLKLIYKKPDKNFYNNKILHFLFKNKFQNLFRGVYDHFYITDSILHNLNITKELYIKYLTDVNTYDSTFISDRIRENNTNIIITPPKDILYYLNNETGDLLQKSFIFHYYKMNKSTQSHLSNKFKKISDLYNYFNDSNNDYCLKHKSESKDKASILIFEHIVLLKSFADQLLENNGMNPRTSMSATKHYNNDLRLVSFEKTHKNNMTLLFRNETQFSKSDYDRIFLNIFVNNQTIPMFKSHLNDNVRSNITFNVEKDSSTDFGCEEIYDTCDILKAGLLEYSKVSNMVHYKNGLFQLIVDVYKLFESNKMKL